MSQSAAFPASIQPGDRIVLTGKLVAFYPPGHPKRTTQHGPLIDGRSNITYVGPYPGRPGIHIARYVDGTGQEWEVPFKVSRLVT